MIGHIFGIPVGNDKIPVAIVVKVCNGRCPAPVRLCDARIKSDVRKNRGSDRIVRTNARPAVQLQHIADILILIAVLIAILIDAIVVRAKHHLLPVIVFRVHIQLDDVRQAIVVDIDDVLAHGVGGRVLEIFGGPVGEGAVVIVDVKNILGEEIIGDIDILPAVAIEIGYRNAMRISFLENARLAGNIGEDRMSEFCIPVIAIETTGAWERSRLLLLA